MTAGAGTGVRLHNRTTHGIASQSSAALDSKRELAPLLLRLFFGIILVWGTVDNVLSYERMLEFRNFLAVNHFPMPLFSARLSAYAQFVSGILLMVGFLTRLASAVMIVNFVVALLMVHVGLPLNANIAPLAMLVCGIFFVLWGAPRYSLDAARSRQTRVDSRP